MKEKFKNKKQLVVILLFIIVLIVLVGVFFLATNKNKEKNYSAELKDGFIIFKENDKEINKYICNNKGMMECSIYNEIREMYFDKSRGIVLLYDGRNQNKPGKEEIFLYDIKNNKKLISFKDVLSIVRINEGDDFNKLEDSFFVTMNNGNMGIFDTEGKMLKALSPKKYVYQDFESCMVDNNTYTSKNDMLVTIVNNKYGIEKISNNDVVVDNKYDDIVLWDNNYLDKMTNTRKNKSIYKDYFKAKINDKWYLYDIKSNEKVTDGYDLLYLLNDKYMIVKNNDKLTIKSINNDLTVGDIKLNGELIKHFYNMSYDVYIEKTSDNMFNIKITYSDKKEENYEVNLENKKITKIN